MIFTSQSCSCTRNPSDVRYFKERERLELIYKRKKKFNNLLPEIQNTILYIMN